MTSPSKSVDTRSFLAALFLAPLATSVILGIPLLMVWPVGLMVIFAPIFGYLPFALVGGPLIWLSLMICKNNPLSHMAASLIAVSLLWPLAQIGVPLIKSPDTATLGYIIAPLWSGMFSWLYSKSTRHPRPHRDKFKDSFLSDQSLLLR